MIYWVAVSELPSQKEVETKNACPKLIVPPTAVEARDKYAAIVLFALPNDISSKIKSIPQDKIRVSIKEFS